MGNSVDQDLQGKCILLKKSVMSKDYQGEAARTVNVTGGNGSIAAAMGHSLYVQFVVDGTDGTFYGEDVEKVLGDAKPVIIHAIEIGDSVCWKEQKDEKHMTLHLGWHVVKIGRKYVYITQIACLEKKVKKVTLAEIDGVTRTSKYA
jgi:hypothetical protein